MDKPLVVITGASSGFGRAMAFEFSEAGYPLLLCARRQSVMEEYGLPNTLCRSVDVADYNSFEAAVREAEGLYGKADLLVNNAGVLFMDRTGDQDRDEWRTMLDVNVLGVLNGIQVVLNDMKARNHGTIINIASVEGRWAYAQNAGYCASKYGCVGLTEAVRKEVAKKNVRVMVVEPGMGATDVFHNSPQKLQDAFGRIIDDMGGAFDPAELARTVRFMYEMPQEVILREVVIAPTRQVD